MIQRLIGAAAFGTAMGVAVGAGCKFDNAKDHCAYADGNDYCGQKYGGEERRYCARGNSACQDRFPAEDHDGCVDARPDDATCYSPCGEGKSAVDDPDCEGVADASSSSVTMGATEPTTEPTGEPTTAGTGSMSNSGSETESASSSTTDTGCTLSVECADPANPICSDMACVPCTSDDECLAKDPGAPACSDEGRCVACTPSNASACTDTTPVCNAASNECEGCNFHEQCPASACRIATGGCFDDAEVYDVGAGQTYASITAAVDDLGEGGEVVLRIHDGPSYDEAVTIAGAGTAYALLAEDDAMVPQWVNTGGSSPTLGVEDGAEVYVQSLRVTLNGDGAFPGIRADGATVYLDRTSVVGNTGGGILVRNGASGYLRNCIIGGTAGSAAAVSVTGGMATIVDSTLVDFGLNARALSCGVAGSAVARNSLFYGEDDVDEIGCTSFDATFTASEQALPGEGNESVALQNASFANFDETDFRLSGSGAALVGDVAQWVAGDPLVDIDGDARAAVDGAMEAAGADIP
jgi:hypothetical protein